MVKKTEQKLNFVGRGKMVIDAKGIEKVIPHRGNMRMIDEVRQYDEHSGIGIHYVRDDEFPAIPV